MSKPAPKLQPETIDNNALLHMNHVNLIGYMTAPAQTVELPDGKQITRFTLATKEQYLDADGIMRQRSQWHLLSAWGRWTKVLETYGVPVIAYGQDEMPAFWSQKSDIPAPLRCDTPQQIVAGLRARQALGLSGGQLIANPVPKADEISADEIGPMIELALHEAHRQGINAKAVTPFLLGRIFELTEGKSLQTNIALVKNNARLAAQIAKSCWELPKS